MKKILITIICAAFLSCGASKPAAKWPGGGKQLIKMCWDNGKARLEVACQDPEYVDWEHSPVTVTSEPAITPWVILAIKAWNEELGFRLFKHSAKDPEADIIFARGGEGRAIRGVTMFFKIDKRMRSGILIFNSAVRSVHTYIHELGHAVGLKHDADDTRSIMYPNNFRYFPQIQKIDKELLISKYKLAKENSK